MAPPDIGSEGQPLLMASHGGAGLGGWPRAVEKMLHFTNMRTADAGAPTDIC